MAYQIKKLDEAGLAKLRSLEDKLGGYIVALEDRFTLADISEEQLKELRSLEKELGATLMAYSR